MLQFQFTRIASDLTRHQYFGLGLRFIGPASWPPWRKRTAAALELRRPSREKGLPLVPLKCLVGGGRHEIEFFVPMTDLNALFVR